MDLNDFALPVGWIALGALACWAAQRFVRDRAGERILGAVQRQQHDLDEHLQRATDRLEQRLLSDLEKRDQAAAATLEARLARLLPDEPQPVEDDAATRQHARRRRVAPEVFAAMRDLHRATGDLVDELHGWPADVDPPDLWDAVDTARSRLHAVFARTRIHLPTPLDTLIAEYRRVVTECLKSQRHSEQLADGRPQAARFAAERARDLLRAADEHFRRIEDDLRGIVEDLEPDASRRGRAHDSPSMDRDATPATPAAGIRPSSRPTMTFESDLLDEDAGARRREQANDASADDDDEDGEDDEGSPNDSDRRPANGGPGDTRRPLD